jgi:hypothetical protein
MVASKIIKILDYKNIGLLGATILLLLLTLLIIKRSKSDAIENFAGPVGAGPVIDTPAHNEFKIDLFKQVDTYDQYNLTNAQKYPGNAAVNMLTAQQNERQYMMSVLTEKSNLASAAVASALAEITKAQARVTMARKHEEKAQKDKEKAELALAQAVIMQTYTASNSVSVDPTVIAKTVSAIGTAIATVTMATEALESAKDWLSQMKRESAQLAAELEVYKLKGVSAATEQMTASKNLNEVSTFYKMSGEAEYVKKRFFPFGTKGSSADRLKCETLAPAAGDKVK